ncbi:MAG: hypothetical protein LUG16_02500, partial [Candidatus Gastranaerophilales bacterium]|nr:hypothetical protein [Candidatus Gastranaerophilales bacterium]
HKTCAVELRSLINCNAQPKRSRQNIVRDCHENQRFSRNDAVARPNAISRKTYVMIQSEPLN